MKERIDKIVSSRALLTRSEAQTAIRQKRVSCDGEIITDCARKADFDENDIRLDGEKLRKSRFLYIMMNKPSGILSATEDRDCETVLDLLPDEYKRRQLGVVGRLDKDVTGLLLLTDDGQLNHRLTSPKSHAPKLYFATLAKACSENDVKAFAQGLDLGDFVTQSAVLQPCENGAFVTVAEGKFHQVKRMFQKVGNEVLTLKRLKIGSLCLDESLAEGQWRELTWEEIEGLSPNC